MLLCWFLLHAKIERTKINGLKEVWSVYIFKDELVSLFLSLNLCLLLSLIPLKVWYTKASLRSQFRWLLIYHVGFYGVSVTVGSALDGRWRVKSTDLYFEYIKQFKQEEIKSLASVVLAKLVICSIFLKTCVKKKRKQTYANMHLNIY